MGSSLYRDVLAVNRVVYDQFAESYEERTRNGHANYLSTFINTFLEHLAGIHVLDLGCGPGRDLAFFQDKGLSIRGVDCSPAMVELARRKGLQVELNDFFGFQGEPRSLDGIWAYTSHTVIPSHDFRFLLRKYRGLLKQETGIIALGMIEGAGEGWKVDTKYDGSRRFVARYSAEELESILASEFGAVWVDRVPIDGKVYLHCLCRNTSPADRREINEAASTLFDQHWAAYETRTTEAVKLLAEDRDRFACLLRSVQPQPQIIDVGCGPGRDLLLFRGMGLDAVGFDISSANVARCHEKGLRAEKGDFHHLETHFGKASFDGAWCNCSVTNWVLKSDLQSLLEGLKSIVRPGGLIFFGSIIGFFRGWEQDDKYSGLKRYNNHWRESVLCDQLACIGTLLYARKLTRTGNKDYLNLIYRNE